MLYNAVSNPEILFCKMIETESSGSLVAARALLATSLAKSKAIASALDRTCPNLELIHRRLPSFHAPSLQNYSFMAIGDHIDHAVGPAAAVVKVHSIVFELEKEVFSDLSSDIFIYLTTVRRLEESLRFLGDNCGLAIEWLEGIVEFMEKKAASGDHCLLSVHKSLRILRKLQGTDECARLPGGCLSFAFNKLGNHFRRLLIQNTPPFRLLDGVAPSPISASTIERLQAILERLRGNGRLDKCISIYVDVRGSNARESLQALDLGYLEISVTESDEVQSLESHVDDWIRHLDLVVKQVLEPEHELCSQVLEKSTEADGWIGCFSKIVSQSGFLALLQFGNKVCQCKKDPFKLVKLLDMFSVMNNLRLDFNRLFRGEACAEIRSLTRDLIRGVVNGACEIFMELPAHVKAQRQSIPPSDGGIPRLVSFVTQYCNSLLGDKYRPILEQVLAIHQIWNNDKSKEGHLTFQVYTILKEIAVNLDSWSKSYNDTSLSYLFMMNNHSHFCSLKGTKLGGMMGESWLAAHDQYKEYYAALYLRESWGRLVGGLTEKGNARDVMKKRLKAFNDEFEEMYKKQSGWAVCEEGLREKICLLVVKGILPVYRGYVERFGMVVEQDPLATKQVKYSVSKMEIMLTSLFQPKLRKYGSCRDNSCVTYQFSSLTCL